MRVRMPRELVYRIQDVSLGAGFGLATLMAPRLGRGSRRPTRVRGSLIEPRPVVEPSLRQAPAPVGLAASGR